MSGNAPSTAGASVALITGGAVRIGRAIALQLAASGTDVAIHYRNSAEKAEQTATEIRAHGVRAVTVDADLSDSAATAGLLPRVTSELGRPVDLLVNNASLFENDSIRTLTPDSLEAHLSVNLKAPLLLARAFADALPESQGGNIINIIDQRVWKPTPWFTSYTVSKAGLLSLTQTLAMALAPRIRVNGIGPGPVLANERQTAEQFRRQWQSTLLQRGAAPEEIAAAVTFLLNAPSMTGQMLALDGGQFLPWPPLSGDVADLDG
ncbi:MAG: SDR family oxidoreductase [Minwuia sp.]|nr:SDR family oxidoreductase [Minwuia sp.]